ncbi:MAG: hypothetical protein L0Z62_24760 [Gemmataceae bacterium]|nr:hypothetical protein [Gemmataceae bacterium]
MSCAPVIEEVEMRDERSREFGEILGRNFSEVYVEPKLARGGGEIL